MEYSGKASNTQHNPGPVQSALEKKEMILGGWNSHREANNTQYHPGPVKDAIEKKEMIPGGWNWQRKAAITSRIQALV